MGAPFLLPTMMFSELKDDVVPAKTVYGIANHLRVPYELMEFPMSHTDGPEEEHWEQFESYLLKLALDRLPDGFGVQHAER